MNRNKIIVKDKSGFTILRRNSGFTIVELLVVITIIGILSTIGVLSYSQIQANTRDSQRSTKMTILAEALEKFYDKNGEYPSCANMTKSASVVSTSLGNMDPDVLKSPSAVSGTNSILFCDNLAAGIDALAYIGDGSNSCLTGTSCLEWTLKYQEEATGNIISIISRRNIAASNAGSISDLAVSSTSFVQAGLTWATVGSAINYNIQKATNSTFTANMIESTVASNTTTVTGLNMNTKYYFRVRSNFTSGSGNWSNVANTTTLNLTIPVATATANSTSQITVNWNAVTNATSYNVDMSTSSSFTSPTSVTGLTATSRAFSGLSSGIKYYFRVQSAALSFTSTWSTTTNATTTIGIPATPTVAASTAGATTTFSWGAATCTGNTARYQYRYTISPSGYNSGLIATASTSVAFTTSTQGQTYTVQAQAECYSAFTASGMSAAGSASYYRIITYTLTIAAGTNGTVNTGGTYNEGTVRTITATPSTLYNFSSWSGSTGCSGVASHTITMDANKSCTANFALGANWLAIGSQEWAKVNLNVGTMVPGTLGQPNATNQTNNAITEKYCYLNDPANCTTYGGFYQWDEAMQYVTTNGAQGICPAGSHIPTDNDWKILEMQLGMTQAQADATSYRGTNQGTQLKTGGSSGLNMPLAGYRNAGSGSFYNLSSYTNLWSSSELSTNAAYAWYRLLGSGDATVYRSSIVKGDGFSVRCLGN